MKSISPTAYGAASGRPRCPQCNGATNRISRRFVDMLLSIFVPVHRYRCREMRCDWEGNLRNPPPASLPNGRVDGKRV